MTKTRQTQRDRRRKKIRKTVSGTAEKPRISVFRSNKYLFVQAIDDEAGKALAALSEKTLPVKKGEKPLDRAERMGKAFGDKLMKAKIETAIFDRGGYKYHGRIAKLADGIRASGIKF